MKKFNAASVIASALAALLLLSSCTPIGKMQQNGWIKKLGEEFPEDTFTYDGHPEHQLTGTDYSTVKVASELYPDCFIEIWKENGELYTDYLALAYEEDIYDELYRVLGGRFPCSDIVIDQSSQDSYKGYPVEDIGAKKFIKNYMNYRCRVILFYDDESLIPGDEEMKELFLDLIDDENHIYDLNIFYVDAGYADVAADDIYKYYSVRFQLVMYEKNHITNIYVDYHDNSTEDHYIVKDMDV